ncbi:MAG TPA: permease [Chloroflexia bacterium]|nr:permease [Chloroflexia bacterium]
MFAGHFGLAAGAKSQAPTVPLWALMLATQLLDVFFVVLNLAGLESYKALDPAHPNAYGGLVLGDLYSHSLVGAALLALIAGMAARAAWGRRGGLVIGAVVFSHWILDLVVHRADMPLLPGNAGNLPLLGLGLWGQPMISAALEAVLVLGGAFLYWRSATRLPAPTIRESVSYRNRGLVAGLVTGLLLVLSLVTSVLGIG